MTKAWIYSPTLDLIIGCGAWSLPLLLLAYPFESAQMPAWTTAFYALALFFNYPHYMATIYRAYHTKGDFNRYATYTKYITGILIITLLVAHGSYRLVPWLFTIYVTWSPWHYMGQNFGLMMMFIRRNGIDIHRKDRNALWTSFVASYLMIFLSFHANPSADPYVLSLGLPSLVDLFRIPMLAVFVVLGFWPLFKLIRRAGWRPMIAPIALYVTEFLWFVLPTVIELVANVRVPQTRYSAGILAVMHSAQYIWITSYYARRESRSWKSAPYFATLVIGGIALFVPGPWLASYAFGRDFTSSFLIITALVNIHHFILDGAVWKLRETRVASLLIREEKPEAATAWKSANSSATRYWKWAAVGVLLLLTGLDQTRHFLLTRNGASRTDLALAASLNPNDASVQTLLGRAYAKSGDTQKMETSLKKSLEINPYNREAVNALAQLYVESQRYDDAAVLYENAFKTLEPDAASLVNFGMLSVGRNDLTAAVRAFEQAIDRNPGYVPAHLYLGQIVEARGNPAAVRSHYSRCEEVGKKTGNRELETVCSMKLQELKTR